MTVEASASLTKRSRTGASDSAHCERLETYSLYFTYENPPRRNRPHSTFIKQNVRQMLEGQLTSGGEVPEKRYTVVQILHHFHQIPKKNNQMSKVYLSRIWFQASSTDEARINHVPPNVDRKCSYKRHDLRLHERHGETLPRYKNIVKRRARQNVRPSTPAGHSNYDNMNRGQWIAVFVDRKERWKSFLSPFLLCFVLLAQIRHRHIHTSFACAETPSPHTYEGRLR